MATYPIITDVTATQLANLIATNALEEGLQYKDTTNNILYLATSDSTVLKLDNWLNWVDVPDSPDSPGEENQVARQADRFYYYDSDVSKWRMVMYASTDWAHCVEILFDSKANADGIIGGDSGLVATWNTYLGLPGNGSPFTSVKTLEIEEGYRVRLYGGANVAIKQDAFSTNYDDYGHVISIVDTDNCIISLGYNAFGDYSVDSNGIILEVVDLPAVTTIGDYCFYDNNGNNSLKQVNLPSLTTAGDGCFDSAGLTSINFPLLTTAGYKCFIGCYSLTSISLPLLETAGEQCFAGCNVLTSVNLPSLTTAGFQCLSSCLALTDVDLPLLETAGDGCFQLCTALTSISLPSLTTAGSDCFTNCTALLSVDLPSLITAGDYCFYDCSNLVYANLPLLETAGYECFYECYGLTVLNLPSLITADDYCFEYCSYLVSLNLPSLVTAGYECFYDCEYLTTLNLPSLVTVGDWCFDICYELTSISLPVCEYLGTTVGDNNVFSGVTGNTITLTIPSDLMTCNGGNPDGDIAYLQANNTVTIINSDNLPLVFQFTSTANANTVLGGDATQVATWNTFFNITVPGYQFTSVTLDNTQTYPIYYLYGGRNVVVPNDAISGTDYLIRVDDLNGAIITLGVACFESEDNFNYASFPAVTTHSTIDPNDYGAFEECVALTYVNLPSLVNVGERLCYDCYVLVDIVLPYSEITTLGDYTFYYTLITDSFVYQFNNVTTAGDYCFGACYELISINLPSLVTAGDYCFYDCSNSLLVSMSLPSLTTAGDYCFAYCSGSGLTSISLPSLTTIGENCFYGCTYLTTLDLPLLTTAAGWCFQQCTSLTSINLPLLTTAGHSSFDYCTSLETINFPLLTTAGEQCFYNCTSLTSVSLPALTTIGDNCFESCEALTSLSLPELTTAGYYSFGDCPALVTISLPKLVTAGIACFEDCEGLLLVTLPLLETIGAWGFDWCTSLTSVSLPSLVSAGDHCFYYCNSLESISLPVCTDLGGSVLDNLVFGLITGQTITLTIPPALMTCNSGNPDGDIQYLQANNIVTINYSGNYTIFEFDTLANASDTIGGDATLIADWNTAFGLPSVEYGSAYTGLTYVETDYSVKITLYGGSGIKLSSNNIYFSTDDEYYLLSIEDHGCITKLEGYVFYDCYSLRFAILPYVTDILSAGGDCELFLYCYRLHYIDLGALANIDDQYSLTYPWCYDVATDIDEYVTLRIPSAMKYNKDIMKLTDVDTYYTSVIFSDKGGLQLTIESKSDIDSWIGGDSSLVATWNTFFNLPAYGAVFTSVELVYTNNSYFPITVCLQGGGLMYMTGTFSGCSFLGAVYDTDGIIDYLDDYCFDNCDGYLTFVHMPKAYGVGNEVFYDSDYLMYVNMPACYYIYGDLTFEYAFYNYFSRFELDWANIEWLPDSAFNNCEYWEGSVYMPRLTTAQAGCFYNCNLLTSVSLPLLTSTANSCFKYCYGLTEIDLPSLITVGDGCFYYCYGLTEIDLPSLTTAGTQCFQYCSSLTSVSLPKCTSLGPTVGDNNVFLNVIGQTITLTVPLALATCNGGNPDGDIQYLAANNNETIIYV